MPRFKNYPPATAASPATTSAASPATTSATSPAATSTSMPSLSPLPPPPVTTGQKIIVDMRPGSTITGETTVRDILTAMTVLMTATTNTVTTVSSATKPAVISLDSSSEEEIFLSPKKPQKPSTPPRPTSPTQEILTYFKSLIDPTTLVTPVTPSTSPAKPLQNISHPSTSKDPQPEVEKPKIVVSIPINKIKPGLRKTIRSKKAAAPKRQCEFVWETVAKFGQKCARWAVSGQMLCRYHLDRKSACTRNTARPYSLNVAPVKRNKRSFVRYERLYEGHKYFFRKHLSVKPNVFLMRHNEKNVEVRVSPEFVQPHFMTFRGYLIRKRILGELRTVWRMKE